MITSASTNSLSKVEFSPSLSEVVTRVWPWSSSHLRIPSSFSVVPRRPGTYFCVPSAFDSLYTPHMPPAPNTRHGMGIPPLHVCPTSPNVCRDHSKVGVVCFPRLNHQTPHLTFLHTAKVEKRREGKERKEGKGRFSYLLSVLPTIVQNGKYFDLFTLRR